MVANQRKVNAQKELEAKKRRRHQELSEQYKFGIKYENGEGVVPDNAEAVKWYTKAAEQGKAEGQRSLGLAYYTGTGVQRDYKQAVEWHRKAAMQGLDSAQRNLGIAYYNSADVPQDYKLAYAWASLSAA